MPSTVGVVVPTLGTRHDYLVQCLESIKRSGDCYVLVVAPSSFNVEKFAHLIDQFVLDPSMGLPAAINLGIQSLPAEITYVNWLGDDDLLAPNTTDKTVQILERSPDCVAVFGSCEYINDRNKVLFINRSGQWAARILSFGPDLIPQPGALIRRDAFDKIGYLDTSYQLAFDFDMFLKLKKIGKVTFVNEIVSSFRWHSDSMSVGRRKISAKEARIARTTKLPKIFKAISPIWEFPLEAATNLAGKKLSAKYL